MSTEQFIPTPEFLKSQGLSATIIARFYKKVRITESCWVWIGYITDAQVIQMRQMSDSGMRQKEVAQAFNANWVTVHNIVTRKKWKHLP